MRFSLLSIKCSGLHPAFHYGDQIVEYSSDNETVLGSSGKLRGAVENLIDGSEKRICRLRFEILSPHVIERRSKGHSTLEGIYFKNSESSTNSFTYFFLYICFFVC